MKSSCTNAMKRLLLTFVMALLIPGAVLSCQQNDTRVLVFSKTMGYRHASIEPGIEAIRRLGREHGFDVASTENAAVFDSRLLMEYDVIVFLSTTEDVLNEDQQEAMMTFVRGGGGYVGVHAASDTEYEWPWYGSLVGAYFVSHPNNPNVREGHVTVAESHRDVLEYLPDPWIRSDEWYDFRNFDGSVDVWLNVDETSYKRPEESPLPEPRPIAWSHTYDGGRAFYTGMGHTVESYTEPLFLEHLWHGIRFVITGDK